jgi:hypothetical protein
MLGKRYFQQIYKGGFMNAVCRAYSVLAAAGLILTGAYGQEYPFSDEFSIPAQTNSKWAKWWTADGLVSATCAGGVYTIVNSHTDGFPGIIYHHFTTQVSTLTASCVITRSSDTIEAGMWLCLPAFSNVSGYLVTVEASGSECMNFVRIYRFVSGSGTPVWQEEYHQRSLSNPSDTLKISKDIGTLKIFCNGVYLGSYTDGSPLAAGDFALVVQENSTAVFDDVLFTDQSAQGGFPLAFTDNFNDGAIGKQWVMRNCGAFAEHDTVLDINVPAPASNVAFAELMMPIDTFYSSLIVSHRSGDSNVIYGFYLRGPDSVAGSLVTWHTAGFCITGLKACVAFASGGAFSPQYPPQGYIHGKAFVNGPGDTIFYQDTIEVMRTSGSIYYIMYVNGNAVDTLLTSEITFQVVGAGIYVGGGQNVFADYFFLGPDSSATGVITIANNARLLKGLKFSPMTSRYLYNPLGRVVGRRDASGHMISGVVAPGFYITDARKSGIIINKQER